MDTHYVEPSLTHPIPEILIPTCWRTEVDITGSPYSKYYVNYESLTADVIVSKLNEWLAKDAVAVGNLFRCYSRCDASLANDPHVQCRDAGAGVCEVGFLGLLNGLLLSVGSQEIIVGVYDDESRHNLLYFATKRYEGSDCEK